MNSIHIYIQKLQHIDQLLIQEQLIYHNHPTEQWFNRYSSAKTTYLVYYLNAK